MLKKHVLHFDRAHALRQFVHNMQGLETNRGLMKHIPPKTRVFSGAGPFFHSRLAPIKNHAFYIYGLASVYMATQAPKIGISWPSISIGRPRVGENVSLNQITV